LSNFSAWGCGLGVATAMRIGDYYLVGKHW
jgi:hypothetical protein